MTEVWRPFPLLRTSYAQGQELADGRFYVRFGCAAEEAHPRTVVIAGFG